MATYLLYTTSTGRLIGHTTRETAPEAGEFGPSRAFIEAQTWLSTDTHYVTSGVVTPRPASTITINTTSITANGTSTATISNIPSGSAATVIDVNGEVHYTVTDGLLEITSDVAGPISVVIPTFPPLDFRTTVTAT